MWLRILKKQDFAFTLEQLTLLPGQQFMEKMINGGKQLEQHKGKHGGRHWRYFYQLHKEGKLEAEYERVIGSAYFEALRKDGFIIPDVTIPNFFKRLKPDI